MPGKAWTKQQTEILKENAGISCAREVAEILADLYPDEKWNASRVRRRARHLGLELCDARTMMEARDYAPRSSTAYWRTQEYRDQIEAQRKIFSIPVPKMNLGWVPK